MTVMMQNNRVPGGGGMQTPPGPGNLPRQPRQAGPPSGPPGAISPPGPGNLPPGGPAPGGQPPAQPPAGPPPGGGGPGGFGSEYYQPGQMEKTNLAVYQPGQLGSDPMSTYKPGQINQYQNVDQGPMQGATQDAIMKMLQSGGSMNPQVQAQMESKLRDQAAIMQKSGNAQLAQNFAGRGGAGAAQQAALQAALGENTQSNLLNSFRDLGVQAAQQNWGDMAQAAGLGEQSMTGQVNRATQQYGAGLQGQMSQEELNQAGINSEQQAQQFALNRALSQEGLNQAGINSQNQNTQWGHQQFMDNEGLRQQQANFGMQGRGGDITMRGQTLQNQQFGQDLNFRKWQQQQQAKEAAANRSASGGAAAASRAQQQAQWEQQFAWQQQQALMQALLGGGGY